MDKSPYLFRVFNTDFVEENLHWDSQEAEPIFILGKEDIESQKQIELLKQEIANLSYENRNKEKEKDSLNKNLDDKLNSKAKELDRIKPPYGERKLKNRLEEIKPDPEKYRLNEKDVQELLETLRASLKDKLSEVSIEMLPKNKIAEIEKILDKTVVSQAIERLKNNPQLISFPDEKRIYAQLRMIKILRIHWKVT